MGFVSPIVVGAPTQRCKALSSTRRRHNAAMSAATTADVYISLAAVRDGKAIANRYGTIVKQCVEGTATSNSADSKRTATLSREFRLRQASVSEKYADLYATRREAMCLSGGAHWVEDAIVKFPISADRKVRASREAALACDRYFKDAGLVDDYMHGCVTRQYNSAVVTGSGVYGTGCADGAASGQADTARVAGLAVEYAAGMLSESDKTRRFYNSIKFANAVSRGCTYEEELINKYPKMACAIRGLSTGAYAAVVSGASNAGSVSLGQMGKTVSLEERLKGDNALALFPGSAIRAAVKRSTPPWVSSPLKNYAPMSEAAVQYGKNFAEKKYDESNSFSEKWSPGWKPAGVLNKTY